MTISQTSQELSKWTIGSQVISLYQQSDRFVVSKDSEEKSFRPSLYDIHFASNVIHMFYKTIKENLRCEEKPHSSCFLPKFCVRETKNPDIHIALFGRVVVPQRPNNAEEQKGILQGVRWGVFNIDTEEEHTFEVINDQVVEDFIRGAPASDKPHMITYINTKGKSVQKPALDHYAMTSYMKRFRVDLMLDTASRVQGVALHHISLLDPKVVLSDHDWAVTLVSTGQSTRSFWSKIFSKDYGHALVAYEGVENGRSFLNYLHLTQHPRNRNPELKSDEAQLETLTLEGLGRPEPLDTLNGPTWVRSKALVENMVNFASEMRETPIKFVLYGDRFWSFRRASLAAFKSIIRNDHGQSVIDTTLNINEIPIEKIPSTCLNWGYNLLGNCGVFFVAPINVRIPIKKVKQIQSAPITTIPEELDTSFLGEEPIPNDHIELIDKLMTSCVILTPKDCSIENCEKWGGQLIMENFVARERCKARLKARLEEAARRGGLREMMKISPGQLGFKHW